MMLYDSHVAKARAHHFQSAVHFIEYFDGHESEVRHMKTSEIIHYSHELTAMENCLADD